MKKDSKVLKKRYGKDWKSVMHCAATNRAKEAGDTSKSDKRYAYEETQIDELNRYAKETGKNTGALNKRPGSPVKPKGDEPGALRNVRGMMRQQTGKPEGQKRRQKLADTPYKKLSKDEQDKDKVSAKAIMSVHDKQKKAVKEEVSRRSKPSAIRKKKTLEKLLIDKEVNKIQKEDTAMQDNNLFGDAYASLKKKIGSKKKHNKPAFKEGISFKDFCIESSAAWQRKEGKNKEGGLNEKGRKSYERENPGSDLKAPQPEGGSRKKSFCARMGGMKKKLTSSKTANDPDSRINKALRKWKC